mgnify:CR=1 FL=1
MELGILNRIDQNLRRNNHRQTEHNNNSEDEVESANISLDNKDVEKENKFYSIATIDWLSAQVRI